MWRCGQFRDFYSKDMKLDWTGLGMRCWLHFMVSKCNYLYVGFRVTHQESGNLIPHVCFEGRSDTALSSTNIDKIVNIICLVLFLYGSLKLLTFAHKKKPGYHPIKDGHV